MTPRNSSSGHVPCAPTSGPAGPGSFGKARGYDLQAHNGYGQIVGKIGIIGACAFLLLLYGFFMNAYDTHKITNQDLSLRHTFPTRLISSITITVLLLLFLGYGSHNLYRYTWLWFGAFQVIALKFMEMPYGDVQTQLNSPPANLSVNLLEVS